MGDRTGRIISTRARVDQAHVHMRVHVQVHAKVQMQVRYICMFYLLFLLQISIYSCVCLT